MEVVIKTFFDHDVVSGLIGELVDTFVFEKDDVFGIAGCVLSALSQELRIEISYVNA